MVRRRSIDRRRMMMLAAASAVVLVLLAGSALAQPDSGAPSIGSEAAPRQGVAKLIQAGGAVGYVIIALSVAGIALVVDAFLKLSEEKLMPPALVKQAMELANQRKFAELRRACGTNESALASILASALGEGSWGLDAVREGMEQQGNKQMTRLHQRVGYIGFIAAIAPMLGLLGTVTGMIRSFNVLGHAQGAARPDQLATGISEALVTTCMGLIVAVPLMFFHTFLRDRVTRIGQSVAATCEKLLRIMAVVVENRGKTPQEGKK